MCQELKVWMHAVSVHVRLRCLANVSVVSVQWRCVCKCIIISYRLYITSWVYVLVGVSLRGLQCCSQFFMKWLLVEAVLVVIVDVAHVGATEETVEQVLCSYDFCDASCVCAQTLCHSGRWEFPTCAKAVVKFPLRT